MKYINYLMPLVIIIVVLLIKQLNITKNLENYQNNNLVPTTIDNRTVSILQQYGTSGNALLLGSIDQKKTDYSLFLEILPSSDIAGKMQMCISNSKKGNLKYFHEVIFGESHFKNITIHTNTQRGTLDLYLVKEEGKVYDSEIPVSITCSGNLNSSEIINLSNAGNSIIEARDVPTSDIRSSIPIRTKIDNALKSVGINVVNNKVYIDVEQIKANNIKISDKWSMKENNSTLGFHYNNLEKPNLKILPAGAMIVKTSNDNGGGHINNTLYWCTHNKNYRC